MSSFINDLLFVNLSPLRLLTAESAAFKTNPFRSNSFVLAHSSAKKFYKEQLMLKSSIQWYHMTESAVIENTYSQVFYVIFVLKINFTGNKPSS